MRQVAFNKHNANCNPEILLLNNPGKVNIAFSYILSIFIMY